MVVLSPRCDDVSVKGQTPVSARPQIYGTFKRADTGVCPYAWNIALEEGEKHKENATH